MIRYLIKNNLKLMFRSPANLFLYVIGPLVVFALLANAFSSLLEAYKRQGPFQVGYRISEESFFAPGMETLQNVAREADVSFEEFKDGEIKDLAYRNDLKGFVEFGEDSYVVWIREDAKAEGQTLEYLLNTFVEEMDRGRLRMMSAVEGTETDAQELRLEVERPKFMPAINSTDYYGIVEIIYFGWCALICAAGILGNEKKYGIQKKYQVAGLSQLQIYLGRLLPMFLMVTICEAVAAVIATTLLGVHWGGRLLLSALVMILMILAASAFELMLYALTDSMVLSVIISFAIVWVWGFLGGSFETYMFSTISTNLKSISPIYHGNRALTELSCMGRSDYVLSSLLISGGMAVGCSALALFFGAARKRG